MQPPRISVLFQRERAACAALNEDIYVIRCQGGPCTRPRISDERNEMKRTKRERQSVEAEERSTRSLPPEKFIIYRYYPARQRDGEKYVRAPTEPQISGVRCCNSTARWIRFLSLFFFFLYRSRTPICPGPTQLLFVIS